MIQRLMFFSMLFSVQKDHSRQDHDHSQSGKQRQRFGKHRDPGKRRAHGLNGRKDAGFARLHSAQAKRVCKERDHSGHQSGQAAEQCDSGRMIRGGKL